MKKTFTQTAIFLFFILIASNLSAQPGVGISYGFNTAAGAPAAFPAGINQAVPAANQDDFGYLFAPAGMSVRFGGNVYTKIVVSTNGWVALVPTAIAAVPPALSAGGYLNTNGLSTYAGGYPIIAPYWDDIATTLISYNWTAGALWVRWTAKLDKTNAAGANLFWARIDGTTGVINMYYTSAAYTISGTPSASIGIAGVCTGDYYSYNLPAVPAYADSTLETSTISTRPISFTYTFTPYQAYDNCATALDLSPLSAACTFTTININNATTSGSALPCSPGGTDVRDVWVKVTKPAGITNVTFTTAPVALCQSAAGTSIEVFASCGGATIGCSTTSGTNPGFGEITISRPPCAETLYARITGDGDVGGKFNVCVRDVSVAGNGNTCATAISICPPFNQTGLSTAGRGNDYDSILATCHSPWMHGEDYIFSYTPTVNTCATITISNTGPNPGLFLVDGCPDLGTTNCIASSESSTNSASINSINLVAGVTYYIIVDQNIIGGSMPFDINVTTSVGAPANDDCAGAIPYGLITSTTTCSWQTFNTNCSTPSAVVNNPTCATFIPGRTGDVWLSFNVNFTGSIVIDGRPGAVGPNQNSGMAVYAGSCGGTVYACDDNSGSSNMPSLTIPVIAGTTYYIRYWTVNPYNSGSFDICIYSASGCTPANDRPCGAISMPIGGTALGDNSCATSLSEPPNAAQCVLGTINTVWYRVLVPASGSVHIRTHLLTLTDSQIGAYTFALGCANAATTFVYKGCNDDGPGCSGFGAFNDFSDLTVPGLTPGDSLFIAVDGTGAATGTFEISAVDGVGGILPPVPLQDCGGAQQVCNTANITVAQPGPRNYGNICDMATGYSCWGVGEYNSAWYQFTCNPGTLQFSISSGCSVDLDFMMWDITGIPNACANLTTMPTIRCNYAASACSTGIATPNPYAFDLAINVTGTPHTYLLFLNNFNSNPAAGYTINWMGSPIAAAPSSIIWTGITDTLYETTTNWGDCGVAPACGVDAVIATTASGRMPTIRNNQSVRSLTINPGATLRLQAPFTLTVCGDFLNNGTFIAEPGSTVNFVGNANQSISGSLTGANSFSNLTITKTAPGVASLNSNIDVGRNFLTTNATSVFSINGKYMKVTGNFTNASGTTTFTGIGKSTVEFNGNTNQFFTNNAGSINLNRVVMNKPLGKLYLTNTFSSMNIDTALTLTSGIIVTRWFPNLEVNMKHYLPASITGHNALSFIDGKLRRKIANGVFSSPPIPASYDFPVGDSTVAPSGYENANITFTSATLVNDLLCFFTKWPAPPGVPLQGPVASECVVASYDLWPLFDNGYWSFTRSTATISGNYRISLYNTGVTNNLGAGWTVVKSDVLLNPSLISSWRLLGNCVVASTPTNVQRININPSPVQDSTSFNHFYASAQSNFALPIELLFFSAEPKGEAVLCKWETASETNNDYFNVERSEDGIEYHSIGIVRGFGQGTSTETIKYSLTDHELCDDIRYYRLKQVDIDGRFAYSDPVAINCKRSSGIELYPNPAKSTITYQFSQTTNSQLTINIIDLTGRIVKSEVVDGVKGINVITSHIDELAAGAYFIQIANVNDSSVKLQAQFFKD